MLMRGGPRYFRRTDERQLDLGEWTVQVNYRAENTRSGDIVIESITCDFGTGIETDITEGVTDEVKDEIIHGLKNHEVDLSDYHYEQERERRAEEKDLEND